MSNFYLYCSMNCSTSYCPMNAMTGLVFYELMYWHVWYSFLIFTEELVGLACRIASCTNFYIILFTSPACIISSEYESDSSSCSNLGSCESRIDA